MSAGRSSEALAVAELALVVHRSPARHAELLRGNAPLPVSIGVLLRLAGGTGLSELDPELVLLAPESELRKAALFFIEQVLFQREATHYRVLGLNQDAVPEQIKEHHRLLMRLFHPDRGGQPEERREQFATRTNLAYNTLRDADSRARYDQTLKPLAAAHIRAQQPRRSPAVVRRRMARPESFWSVRVHPLLMRYLPQWVLAGTALVSVAVVGAIYVFNPPLHLQKPQNAPRMAAAVEEVGLPEAETAAMAETAADAALLEETAAQFEQGVADAAGILPDPVQVGEAMANEPAIEIAAPAAMPVRVVATAAAKPAQAAPSRPARKSPVRVVEKTAKPAAQVIAAATVSAPVVARPAAPVPLPAQPVRQAYVVAPAVLPAAAPAAEPSPQTVEPPPMPDPNSLLNRFLAAYERGDMQACMSLLDEGLRANAGGKSELRREYDALFRTTDLRHVKITGMSWSHDAEFIRGEGHYRATVMRKGETLLRSQDGLVRVELVRRGSSALISELRYVAGGRS